MRHHCQPHRLPVECDDCCDDYVPTVHVLYILNTRAVEAHIHITRYDILTMMRGFQRDLYGNNLGHPNVKHH